MIIFKREPVFKEQVNGKINLMIKFLFGVLTGIILTIYFQEDLTNLINNFDKILNYLTN